MTDDLELRQLQLRQKAMQSAAQPASEEPSAMDNVLSGRGLLNMPFSEQAQMGAAPVMEPIAQTAAREPPSLSAAGEIIGGSIGAMAPVGRLPGLLAAGARAVGGGVGSFLGSYAGSGGDLEEAQGAGQRGMIGEGIGEAAGGLLKWMFPRKEVVEGGREALAQVRSQGGNLTVGQLTDSGFGKRAQEFIEMALFGQGPLKKTKQDAEKLLETMVTEMVDQFPKQFGPEEAGRIIHKSIERSGAVRIVQGKTLPSGKIIETQIKKKPYTGRSIEVKANRQFLKQLMDKAPDVAYQALASKKSPTAIRLMRHISGPDWDVIQGRYLHDLLAKSTKGGTETNLSGQALFDKVKRVNDPVIKEWLPDPVARKNLWLTARSLALAENTQKASILGGAAIQSALLGGYALGLTGPTQTAMIMISPFALSKLLSSKAYTNLLIDGMKPGLTPAKSAGLLTRFALVADQQGLTEGEDFELIPQE